MVDAYRAANTYRRCLAHTLGLYIYYTRAPYGVYGTSSCTDDFGTLVYADFNQSEVFYGEPEVDWYVDA